MCIRDRKYNCTFDPTADSPVLCSFIGRHPWLRPEGEVVEFPVNNPPEVETTDVPQDDAVQTFDTIESKSEYEYPHSWEDVENEIDYIEHLGPGKTYHAHMRYVPKIGFAYVDGVLTDMPAKPDNIENGPHLTNLVTDLIMSHRQIWPDDQGQDQETVRRRIRDRVKMQLEFAVGSKVQLYFLLKYSRTCFAIFLLSLIHI